MDEDKGADGRSSCSGSLVVGEPDHVVLARAFDEERILVTANVKDFQRLARSAEIHAGIVLVLHGSLPRDDQWALLLHATALIEQEVLEGRSMINRVLEMEENGDGQFYELPPP